MPWRSVASRVGQTAVTDIHLGGGAGPPMGWNSWYAQGPAVTEQAVRLAARALVELGLARAGFDLVVIDDGWQGARGGAFGAIQPNERFGDLRRLAADLHRMGLRLGLYSTPWIASYGGSSAAPPPSRGAAMRTWHYRRGAPPPNPAVWPPPGLRAPGPAADRTLDARSGPAAMGGLGGGLRQARLAPHRPTHRGARPRGPG